MGDSLRADLALTMVSRWLAPLRRLLRPHACSNFAPPKPATTSSHDPRRASCSTEQRLLSRENIPKFDHKFGTQRTSDSFKCLEVRIGPACLQSRNCRLSGAHELGKVSLRDTSGLAKQTHPLCESIRTARPHVASLNRRPS